MRFRITDGIISSEYNFYFSDMKGDVVCLLILTPHTAMLWVMQLVCCFKVEKRDWYHQYAFFSFHLNKYLKWISELSCKRKKSKIYLSTGWKLGSSSGWMDCWWNTTDFTDGCRKETWYRLDCFPTCQESRQLLHMRRSSILSWWFYIHIKNILPFIWSGLGCVHLVSQHMEIFNVKDCCL